MFSASTADIEGLENLLGNYSACAELCGNSTPQCPDRPVEDCFCDHLDQTNNGVVYCFQLNYCTLDEAISLCKQHALSSTQTRATHGTRPPSGGSTSVPSVPTVDSNTISQTTADSTHIDPTTAGSTQLNQTTTDRSISESGSTSGIDSQGSSQDSKGSGLSKGAIIGIAVSAVVVIVVLGSVVGLIIIKRQQRQLSSETHAQSHQGLQAAPPQPEPQPATSPEIQMAPPPYYPPEKVPPGETSLAQASSP